MNNKINKNNRLSTTLTTGVNTTTTTNAFSGLDAYLSGTGTTHRGLPNGEYIATINELTAVEGIAVLKLTVYLNGTPKKVNFKVFDTNRFITEYALANGYAIHSLNEAIGKTMPLYIKGKKYSILPLLPEVGTYNATFQGMGTVNLGKDRAAIYFKWQANDQVFFDFTMFSEEVIEKIDSKFADITYALGLPENYIRTDINNYIGNSIPVYIVQPEGLKSLFINYWKKSDEVLPEVACDIVKF